MESATRESRSRARTTSRPDVAAANDTITIDEAIDRELGIKTTGALRGGPGGSR